MKKVIWLALLLLSVSSSALAEETYAPKLDPETKALCNKVMVNVYKDIIKAKTKYKHLKNFDEKSLFENKHGIYTILYKYEPEEGEDKRTSDYHFGITI